METTEMWEYKRIEKKIDAFSISKIADDLNKYGNEDWEIIYYHENSIEVSKSNRTINVVFLMKRVKNITA